MNKIPRLISISFLILFFLLQCKKKEEKDVVKYQTISDNNAKLDRSCVIPLADGNFLLRQVNDFVVNSFKLTKMSPSGAKVWQTEIQQLGLYSGGFTTESSGGEIYLTARSHDPMQAMPTLHVIKISSGGDLLWNKVLLKSYGLPKAGPIATTASGDIVFLYSVKDSVGTGNWMVCSKIDKNGNLIWKQTICPAEDEIMKDILALPNGEIEVLNSVASTDQIHLIRLSSTGGIISYNFLEKNKLDREIPNDMIATDNGSIMICGELYRKESDDRQVMMMKLDASGNVAWKKDLGFSTQAEVGTSIARNQAGGYVITGFSFGESSLSESAILAIQVTDDGTLQYYRAFCRDENSCGWAVFCDPSNICTVVGTKPRLENQQNYFDIIIARLNSEGKFQ